MAKDQETQLLKSMHDKIYGNPVNEKMQKRYPRDLHKEIWAHNGVKPDQTLYRWWWEFLKASQEYPAVRRELARDKIKKDAISDVENKFGKLGDDFNEWWKNKGSGLFSEQGVPLVTVLMPMPDNDAFKKLNGVVVMIPLSINRQLIQEQLEYILDEYHAGNELKRHEASSAELTIYPRVNYPNTKYDVLINVWRERQKSLKMKDERPWWEIYCDATNDTKLKQSLMPSKRAAKSNASRELSREELKTLNGKLASDRKKYSRKAEVIYQQADVLLRNALIGEFPRDDSFQERKRGNRTG